MKKIYHLSKCTTCRRIIKEWNPGKDVELQEIMAERITPGQLDEMAELSGSYGSLFSKIAIKYRTLGLSGMKLSEKDFRKLILEEYTFLKRPVMIIGKEIFIGNSPKNVQAGKNALKGM